MRTRTTSCKTSVHTNLPLFYLPLLSTKHPHYPLTSSRHALLRHTTTASPAQTSLRRRYMTLAAVSHSFLTLHRFLILPFVAHEAGTLPPSFQCVVEACASELVYARVVEKIANPPVEPPADIWAVGAAVCPILLSPPTLMLIRELRSTRLSLDLHSSMALA
jgi:hypothetical protein